MLVILVKNRDYVWRNSFFDYDNDIYVEFVDIELKNKPKYHYYLFYQMAENSFHSPIEESDIKKHPDLEVIEIDSLITEGKDIETLISMQFVTKVINLVQSGQYIFEKN